MAADDVSLHHPCLSHRVNFFGYIAGFFLFNSAYVSVLNLQSSINIEEGLGTTSLFVTYAVCNAFLVFFTPILLRKFGPKACLIASEFTYLLYVLANLHPKFYTLIPAAFLVGIGEAMMWPSVTLLNFHYATIRAKDRKHPTKKHHFYVNLYSGYFFSTAQASQVFGNSVTYAVLYGFSSSAPSNSTALFNTTNSNNSQLQQTSYEFCGSRDCQDAETVSASINQYVPSSKLALILLMTTFGIMCIGSQVLHAYFLPRKIIQSVEEIQSLSAADGDQQSLNSCKEEHTREKACNGVSRDEKEDTRQFWTTYCRALKDLVYHISDVRQLLIIPLSLYVGFFQAFIFGELTRAYSSCVLGVATVGIQMTIFGLTDCIFSIVVGKFAQRTGRTPFFLLSTLFDCFSFTYCLLWVPNQESAWSIYLLFFVFGCSDGIWQTLVNVLYLDYFKSNQDVAITTWILCVAFGWTVQFSWSSALCVFTKIYVQYFLLGCGMIGYAIAEYYNNKKKESDKPQKTMMMEEEPAL